MLNYILLISGLYSILMSFVLNTKNWKSALMFKFIPFIFGMVQLIIGLQLTGFLERLIK